MTVYIETGYDGKERKFVYGSGYYRKIYKQYKKSLNSWIEQLTKLLYKAKYNQEQIHNIVNHCYDRGYFVSSNYDISITGPGSLKLVLEGTSYFACLTTSLGNVKIQNATLTAEGTASSFIMTYYGTILIEDSTIRAIKGMAATTSGTTVAVDP